MQKRDVRPDDAGDRCLVLADRQPGRGPRRVVPLLLKLRQSGRRLLDLDECGTLGRREERALSRSRAQRTTYLSGWLASHLGVGFSDRDLKEFAMKVVITLLLVVLALPVLLVVGIALGPAALVMLFIGGIALITVGILRLADRARPH
jgi:hypothetical protein